TKETPQPDTNEGRFTFSCTSNAVLRTDYICVVYLPDVQTRPRMRIWNSSFSDSIEVRGVSSLNEVLDHVRNDYHVPPSVPLNIALVEDGTIVDDDEYFGTLARNSELVFLSPWEKFNPWLRKLRDAFSRDPQISSMERVVGDFLSQKREAKTKLLNSYVSRLPVNRSLNSREEDPSWFQGLPGRFKSKDQVMKDRARSRMRNYLRETKEYLRNRYSVNEKEVQFSFSIIRELTDMLKERDYHGHYFNREELARDLRLCDSHGSFKCQGPFNSDICSYVDHQINPYDNRESLILFQNWNLDHGIEKSRTILPGMIQAMKSCMTKGFILNTLYFFNLLFTTVNLKLVHTVCHDKTGHKTKQLDSSNFFVGDQKISRSGNGIRA
ncbi:unnamed protein product, partial [Notodromas monacha]